jgi:hypothetical protein
MPCVFDPSHTIFEWHLRDSEPPANFTQHVVLLFLPPEQQLFLGSISHASMSAATRHAAMFI